MKSLSGSDPITCRDLYKSVLTFKPDCKIWVATNFRPRMDYNDDALWERTREIPFEVHLSEEERDRTVRTRLCRDHEHGAAILAWAVQGCLLWQREGLKQPEVIRAAGLAYRAAMDPLGRFFDEVVTLDPKKWTSTAALNSEYETWCTEEGQYKVGDGALTRKLRTLGCEPQKKDGARGWSGISLDPVIAVSKPTTAKVLPMKAKTK